MLDFREEEENGIRNANPSRKVVYSTFHSEEKVFPWSGQDLSSFVNRKEKVVTMGETRGNAMSTAALRRKHLIAVVAGVVAERKIVVLSQLFSTFWDE